MRSRHPAHLGLHIHLCEIQVEQGQYRADATPDGFAGGIEIVHERGPDVDFQAGKMTPVPFADLRQPFMESALPDGVVFIALSVVASDEVELVDFKEDGERFAANLGACGRQCEDIGR